MSRLERPQTKTKNPATKFLSYKSETKKFQYWNKEKTTNEYIEAPFKFLFLEHYHAIRGWHDSTQKGIISNEVYAISSQPLTVKTAGGLEIANGLYKDIKDKVKLSGGVYHRSIYVMLEDGSIANLQLKGAVIGGLSKESSVTKEEVDGYSEFYKKNNQLLDNQWIQINSFADAKKGATKYSIPIFELGGHISDKEDEQAVICAKELEIYIKSAAEKDKNPDYEFINENYNTERKQSVEEVEDDLPF